MPFCSKCGAQLGEGSTYCPKCGTLSTVTPVRQTPSKDKTSSPSSHTTSDLLTEHLLYRAIGPGTDKSGVDQVVHEYQFKVMLNQIDKIDKERAKQDAESRKNEKH